MHGRSMTLNDTHAYLNALPRFAGKQNAAYEPGLARITRLLKAMGRPHEAFETIHVAGTNGKGSTASLVAAIAAATARRVGLHTSPHLLDVTERMRIGGVPAPADWLAQAVARYRPAFDAVRPSFFEATVALSFQYFAEQAVDLAVVEVGLGGRLDATNVLHPALSIITSIGRDHTALLGETLGEIARGKAGIIKPGVPVLTGADQPEALEVIEDVAAAREAPLHWIQAETEVLQAKASLDGLVLSVHTPLRRYDALRVGLPGVHQAPNALLALRAAELCFREVQRDAAPVYEGMAEIHRRTGLRGRFEVLHRSPLVVADVAHNADGLAATLALLRPEVERRSGKLFVLFGLMRDKDLPAMAHLLAEAGATVLPVHLDSDRALPAVALAEQLEAAGATAGPAGTAAEGLAHFRAQAAPQDALLATGSHQVVASVLRAEDDRRRTADN